MNIFLTNDDGYFSKGLIGLAVALSKHHNVFVVAPEAECSGAGHSISFYRALSYKKLDYPNKIEAYSVNGTPVDCVKFGLDVLAKKQIDLVISGINNQLNLGTDVVYSGTFNAALEGTILGKPSIAVSTSCKSDDDFELAIEFIVKNVNELMKYCGKKTTINVNLPSTDKNEIKGIKTTALGSRKYDDAYNLVQTLDGTKKYMLGGTPFNYVDLEKCCDVAWNDRGYITVVPITLFTTDQNILSNLQTAEFKL